MDPPARRASSDKARKASAAPPRRPAAGASSRASSSAPRAREFQQKEGFSMLAPDKEMYKDLLRRQRVADQARPKPKASDIRFSGMLDPTKAAQPDSAVDREAARSRWVAEMQAKAHPNEIRRQARKREEEKREQERMEEHRQRKAFEKEWHAREALRQEVQEQRTAEVNAQAKQHWAGRSLPEAQQSSPAEPIVPVPENVDFAAVRRKLAAERAGRGAAIVRASSARHTTRESQAALGLSAQAVPDLGARAIIAAQNAEYEMSLLSDQLKALQARRSELVSAASRCQEELDATQQQKLHLEQRLERYGENPKFQAQLDEALKAEEIYKKELSSARQRLSSVEAEVEQLEHSLAAATSG
eukprot:TRINITY_DN64143_c0_g1_i1.p1 TRINITY_DN64143_c0_g1~~TRINITY_DN64143_c0_g1_i1.p1  ORF type:complete len:359 (-),score=106.83 TRINITY_DN64143_c0_g1_i1:62-1138(-)